MSSHVEERNVPSLPPLEVQIIRGLNRYCRLCNVPVDRRSKTCKRCHLIVVALNRFPPHGRVMLTCRDCGGAISYRSARGHGRCRNCHFQQLKENPRPKRSAFRDVAGTAYQGIDGNVRYANDKLKGFTVASAWGSLRRCWKAVRIARNNGDEEAVNKYLSRVRYLQRLLNLEVSDFSEW